MDAHHCRHDATEACAFLKVRVFSSAKLEYQAWFLGFWLVSKVTLTLIHPEQLDTSEQRIVPRQCTGGPFQQALGMCTAPE